MRLPISALFLSVVLPSIAASAQSSQTLTGTVTDAMCGAHHMMQGASAAQCTRECVKQGSDFALVGGGKVYTLKGDKSQFDKFARAECDHQRKAGWKDNHGGLDRGCQVLESISTITDSAAATALSEESTTSLDDQDGQRQECCC